MMMFLNFRYPILSLLICVTASAAAAQSMTQPLGAAPQPFGPPIPGVPSFSQNPPPTLSLKQVVVNAGAAFSETNEPIRSGLLWRVFEDKGDTTQPNIIARSSNPTPSFTLAPGNYIVHVAYGFASASKRISVQSGNLNERLVVSAGALRLKGAVGESPIAANRVSFSIYLPEAQNSEGRLVIANAKANEVIRLPEGTYHVVSTYGDANAIMRSDLKVESGKVTEATLNHRAATVTLKLVASEGGEAFAGTAFSVLTPGGDVIREAIGAFPSVTLAEGEYVLIARHEGKVYTKDFKVESGLDRDIEVLATP
ncbi:hypothetical protein SAMN02927923_04200 [Microvirga guangxiensis]|uniref:Carboxypeptidase regulatory-like domain-containing protein n=2 Tax=Microvirga guangxiensis TaxID=549386 RepID=A0A1G5LER1_9HYPH|nr:hypothetical protein [Microvirga guangxiensis]SCZ11114.1 hypothetical protein SAMN02927923_04200 [Microvirga guangxiensis]